MDVRLWETFREQDGKAARARADVGHVGHLGNRRQPLRDGLRDEFDEVGAGDDDALVDMEAQASQPGFADEVAGRDAVEDSAFYQREEGRLLLGRQGRV